MTIRQPRQERLKNLMKNRNTIEQGLTLYQIFSEVYSDIVEEFHKEYGLDASSCNSLGNYDPTYDKNLRRLIKHVRETDDAFRHLRPVPCKNDKGKIKEYKYVNINTSEPGSYGYELLTEVHSFWLKHAEASQKGLERKMKRLEMLAEMTEEQGESNFKRFEDFCEYEVLVRKYIPIKENYLGKTVMGDTTNIKKIIAELKEEGHLSELKGTPDYRRIKTVIEKELLNKQMEMHGSFLTCEGKLPSAYTVRKIVKDTIATYCNNKKYGTKEEYPTTTRQLQLDR